MTRNELETFAFNAGFRVEDNGAINDGVETAADFSWELQRFAQLVITYDREKLAKKIEKLPFGDTAQSFAVWVREQDV